MEQEITDRCETFSQHGPILATQQHLFSPRDENAPLIPSEVEPQYSNVQNIDSTDLDDRFKSSLIQHPSAKDKKEDEKIKEQKLTHEKINEDIEEN